jgi:predicted transcriptional regulator
MDIAGICRREIVTISEDASVQQAASLMRAQHVGTLVVTAAGDAAPRAVGVVSDRDLAIEVLARGLDATARVGQIARPQLAAVPASAGVAEAVGIMQRAGVRRLLVTEGEGRIAGFVSSDDILDQLARELGGLAGALHAGQMREHAERKPLAERAAAAPTVFLPQGTPGWSSTWPEQPALPPGGAAHGASRSTGLMGR